MADGKRRLAAIMSADVAGYARLMQDDEAATVETLTKYRDVFRDLVARHDGRVVDTPGDNVLAEFASPIEAVQAAADIQFELARRNHQLADHRRMLFRIGINLGDVIANEDGSLYGDGVNIAARLEAMAEPGGITIDDDAYRQVRNKLDLIYIDLGDHEIKNISEQVHVYSVSSEGQPGVAAPPQRQPKNPIDRPSIAVLPFDNLSGDPEQAFFADGLAEDLLTALSRIHWLFVTARNSSFSFKDHALTVADIAASLGVRYIVEGSVRKAGNRLRVTAQLIDTTNDSHVWAARYDRELEDIFAIQEEITEKIVAAVEPEIGNVERKRALNKPPESLDAWEHYQRGLWHMYQITAVDNAEAKRLFKRAIELDPMFGSGHTGLGYAHFLDTIFGFTDASDTSIQQSFRAIKKAISLDDRDAMAHYTLGRLYMLLGDPELSEAESEHAIRLNPSLALAHFGLGHAKMLLGRPEDGIVEIDLAIQLSPSDPVLWAFECVKAVALILMGQPEPALEWARKSTRHPTAGVWAFIAYCAALGHTGSTGEAQLALKSLFDIKPDFNLEFIRSYLPFQRESDYELYVDGLIKAGLEKFVSAA